MYVWQSHTNFHQRHLGPRIELLQNYPVGMFSLQWKSPFASYKAWSFIFLTLPYALAVSCGPRKKSRVPLFLLRVWSLQDFLATGWLCATLGNCQRVHTGKAADSRTPVSAEGQLPCSGDASWSWWRTLASSRVVSMALAGLCRSPTPPLSCCKNGEITSLKLATKVCSLLDHYLFLKLTTKV